MIQTLFTSPVSFIFSLISIVVAITIHEYAHAKAADHLGDPTPRIQGRLSLSPTAHLDLYGSLLLLIFGFGWGKPVQFDPYNLRNPRRDAGIISVAGPISNILLAVLASIILRLFYFFDVSGLTIIGSLFLTNLIVVNLGLAVFNLIPIHPLDGFKIVGALLNKEQAREWYQLERYGMIFLLILILPIGGKSMLHSLLDPILSFLFSIFIPLSGSGII